MIEAAQYNVKMMGVCMIGIDMTFIRKNEIENGHLTEGVSIYCEQILKGIQMNNKQNDFVLLSFYSQEKFIRRIFPSFEVRVIDNFIVKFIRMLTGGSRLLGKSHSLLRKFTYSSRISDLECIWFPFATNRTFVDSTVPTICTIHDLIMYRNGTKVEKQKYKQFIEKSTLIVTISNIVKKEIKSEFDYAGQIYVIPNAVEIHNEAVDIISELCNYRYILDVNAFAERKNTITLLKAYARIKEKINRKLVLCGGYKEEEYFRKIKEVIIKERLEKYVYIYIGIDEKQKNFLFKNADLFVMPSVEEGFGRTPVEAAINEIPVICSDIPVLREVTLDMLNYYRPITDEVALANKIMEVLNKRCDRSNLSQVSNAYKNYYSIEKCLAEYLKIFEKYRS